MPPTLEQPKPEIHATKSRQPRFTTPEQLARYQKHCMEPERKWQRKKSDDTTLHRCAHIFPELTGATGEDFVNHPEGADKGLVQFCFWRVCVERFEEEAKTDPKTKESRTERKPLGSFFMDAEKFLEEFQSV